MKKNMDEENKQPDNANGNEELRMPLIANNTDEELEKYKKQAEEYLAGWKRAKADYLNLKKEMESQNREIKEWMAKVMMLPLLEVMDSFDAALSSIPESIKNDSWIKGAEGIRKQLEDYFKSHRVEIISAKGEKFDPIKHEAVAAHEVGEPRPAVAGRESGESGTIAEELQKGYLINGEILRPAKVKVYK